MDNNALGDLRTIINNDPLGQTQRFHNLGGILTSLLSLIFILAGFLMFIWALMGIFQYITAGGSKEGLAKARAKITWAIVGFIFVAISFALSGFIHDLIQPNEFILKNITTP